MCLQLKSDSHLPPPQKKKKIICFNESLLKVIKSSFYFILRALFVLKIFKIFALTFWSCRKNSLIRKINFKIYDIATCLINNCSTHVTQAIHILLNISQSKCNQTIQLGQLIGYNKRNVFLQKIMQEMRQGG